MITCLFHPFSLISCMIAHSSQVVFRPEATALPTDVCLTRTVELDSQSPVVELLNSFRETLANIRQSELSRYRKQLSDAEYALVDAVAEQMMQRIAVRPSRQLLASDGEAGITAGTFASLFHLTPDTK